MFETSETEALAVHCATIYSSTCCTHERRANESIIVALHAVHCNARAYNSALAEQNASVSNVYSFTQCVLQCSEATSIARWHQLCERDCPALVAKITSRHATSIIVPLHAQRSMRRRRHAATRRRSATRRDATAPLRPRASALSTALSAAPSSIDWGAALTSAATGHTGAHLRASARPTALRRCHRRAPMQFDERSMAAYFGRRCALTPFDKPQYNLVNMNSCVISNQLKLS